MDFSFLPKHYTDCLAKAELYKKNTKTALDLDEIKIGLQIVPKFILKFLSTFLSQMQPNDNKDLPLDFAGGVGNRIRVTKHDFDVYTGDIYKDGQIVTSFANRSIPGIALVIMSAFELYDSDDLELAKITPADDEKIKQKSEDLDKLIDQKIQILALIEGVISQKISEKNAVEQLFLARLLAPAPLQTMAPMVQLDKPLDVPAPKIERGPIVEKKESMKSNKLKDFLEKKQQKRSKDFVVKIEKAEATCPHCNQNLFNDDNFNGCVCLGEDLNNQVLIAKSEKGIKLSFHKSWDMENVLTVLQALKVK